MIIFFFVKLGLRLLDDSPDNVSIDEIGQWFILAAPFLLKIKGEPK